MSLIRKHVAVLQAWACLDLVMATHHIAQVSAPALTPATQAGTRFFYPLTLSRKIDALDNWCLRRILNIHWSEFVTNDEIRSSTGQPLLTDTIRSRRLSFFGHLHRADPWQDHHRALQACIMDPPGDWRRRAGRPRQSWLRTVEADLRPMNLGLETAKRRAQDRSAWRILVATATSSKSS